MRLFEYTYRMYPRVLFFNLRPRPTRLHCNPATKRWMTSGNDSQDPPCTTVPANPAPWEYFGVLHFNFKKYKEDIQRIATWKTFYSIRFPTVSSHSRCYSMFYDNTGTEIESVYFGGAWAGPKVDATYEGPCKINLWNNVDWVMYVCHLLLYLPLADWCLSFLELAQYDKETEPRKLANLLHFLLAVVLSSLVYFLGLSLYFDWPSKDRINPAGLNWRFLLRL